ncbi:hypothetical protein ScPMuIL_012874 [Solemya velum]
MEADPFPGLKISSSDWLDRIKERSICQKCRRSRKYFCYTCLLPVSEVTNDLPRVELPLKVDIIKHPQEVDGKSTAAHAAILAPGHVTVYTYPDIPVYDEPEKVLLLFPGKDAISLSELAERVKEEKRLFSPGSENSSATSETDIFDKMECHYHTSNGKNIDSARKTRKEVEHSDVECTEKDQLSIYHDSRIGYGGDDGVEPGGCHDNKNVASSDVDYVRDKCSRELSVGSKNCPILGNNGIETGLVDSKKCLGLTGTRGVENGTDVMKSTVHHKMGDEGMESSCCIDFNDLHISHKNVTAQSDVRSSLPFHTVIFVDSTWNQTFKITSDKRLSGLTRVEIQGTETKFWRHQKRSPTNYLSTIEAIYFFFREFHDLFLTCRYVREYDDLLFLFKYMYKKMNQLPGGREPRAYEQRRNSLHQCKQRCQPSE